MTAMLSKLASHSFSTALRQIYCALEVRRHSLGRKVAPPINRLPCGIIGAGRFFHYAYLPALNRKHSAISVAGILARNPQTGELAQRGLRYQTRVFSSLDALLDSGINSVILLSPNHLHFDQARLALEHGLNVFCEKPLANNVADALRLQATRQTAGRVLMVDFNQRYLDRNRVLKQLIDQKRIGRITEVHAFHNQDFMVPLDGLDRWRRDRTGGGVLHNAGIHFINLLLHWFGPVERVRATFENRRFPPECGEDTAHCQLWFRNGVVATLDASFANAVDTSYERVQFIGENGQITSDLKKSDIYCRLDGKQRFKVDCKSEVISDSVFNALQAFERCVATGSQPETDVNDFLRTMKVVEALTLSAQRGEEVRMEELERKYAC